MDPTVVKVLASWFLISFTCMLCFAGGDDDLRRPFYASLASTMVSLLSLALYFVWTR